MIARLIATMLVAAPVVLTARQGAYRAATDVVEISAAVTVGRRPASGLAAEDFEVIDNGVRQHVLSVASESVPIDVTLVLDVSGSVDRMLQDAIKQAVVRVQTQMRPADRISILTFNQRVREVLGQVAGARLSLDGLVQASGQTSLNDAIAVAVVSPPVEDRRHMALVFTDGVDTASFLEPSTVLAVAGRSRTAVFIVARAWPRDVPLEFFHQLADATGGFVQQVNPVQVIQQDAQHLEMRATGDLLDETFVRAFDEFRSSYVVRYVVTGVPREGWHDVAIRVIKAGRTYRVRARQRYFAAARGLAAAH
jgi:hypothetical protein